MDFVQTRQFTIKEPLKTTLKYRFNRSAISIPPMNHNADSTDTKRLERFSSLDYFINNFNYFKENAPKRENGKTTI